MLTLVQKYTENYQSNTICSTITKLSMKGRNFKKSQEASRFLNLSSPKTMHFSNIVQQQIIKSSRSNIITYFAISINQNFPLPAQYSINTT